MIDTQQRPPYWTPIRPDGSLNTEQLERERTWSPEAQCLLLELLTQGAD